ncbi:MAG: alpha/beta fold hydrolase [Steroidobacteraceae bacterium]
MRTLSISAAPASIAPVRVVLLTGAFQQPEDFQRQGFVDAVRARNLPLDLQFVAPDLQNLNDRLVLHTLRQDLIEPARRDGCRSIWLGGISLGGFLALAYAERWRPDLGGLCLLAPYVGSRMMTGEISRAGGVRQWSPGTIAADDEERRIWRLIKDLGSLRPPVYLGIGRDDRFGHGLTLFAEALPAAWVDTIDGAHEWPVWRQLWGRFLDRLATAPAGQ